MPCFQEKLSQVRYLILHFNLSLGEYVAQFKFTVLLMPNGPMKITGLPFDVDSYVSEHTVEDEELKVRYSTFITTKYISCPGVYHLSSNLQYWCL